MKKSIRMIARAWPEVPGEGRVTVTRERQHNVRFARPPSGTRPDDAVDFGVASYIQSSHLSFSLI